MVASTSELRLGTDAVVERGLDRRQAVAHCHLDGSGDGDAGAGVLEQAPRRVAQMGAVDVFIARPQQPGAPELEQCAFGVVAHAVGDATHADLACISEDVGVEHGAERQRQQLVLRAEICALQPHDILRVAHVGSAAAPVGVDRAHAGLPQRTNAGVAVLRCMRDLRRVDGGGGAHVDHTERRDEHAGIGIRGRIGRCERIADVATVVGIEQAVGEDAPQQALVEMVMRVDEARHYDAIGGVDHRCVVARNCDARPDFADLAVLDQHIRLREVADAAVEGEDDPALEQDAALALHPGQESIGIRSGSLRAGLVRKERERGRGGGQSRARGQQRPAGRCRRERYVRPAAAGIRRVRLHRMVMTHRGFPPC